MAFETSLVFEIVDILVSFSESLVDDELDGDSLVQGMALTLVSNLERCRWNLVDCRSTQEDTARLDN